MKARDKLRTATLRMLIAAIQSEEVSGTAAHELSENRVIEIEPALRAHHEAGRPILGTCAGLIVCDAEHLGFIDATARRNAFGRQLQSFEADLEVTGAGDEPLRAVFIRAPWIERRGDGVEVLASYDGHPVAVREGTVLASAFHPELTDDPRFHAIFMAMTTSAHERAKEEATHG